MSAAVPNPVHEISESTSSHSLGRKPILVGNTNLIVLVKRNATIFEAVLVLPPIVDYRCTSFPHWESSRFEEVYCYSVSSICISLPSPQQ